MVKEAQPQQITFVFIKYIIKLSFNLFKNVINKLNNNKSDHIL